MNYDIKNFEESIKFKEIEGNYLIEEKEKFLPLKKKFPIIQSKINNFILIYYFI